MKKRKIKALYIEPQRQPRVVSFEDRYENYKIAVKGDIEYCHYLDDAIIVTNAMGKIEGLTRNRIILKDGKPIDIIAGSFLIIAEEEGKSLSKELIEKYKKLFEKQEYFFLEKDDPEAVLWGSQEGLMDEYVFKSPINEKESSILVKKILPTEHFELFQPKDDFDSLRFFPYDYLEKRGRTSLLKKSSYEVVYKGDMSYNEDLNDIYERFNIHHPFDYRHFSLSMGDVIVVKYRRRKKAFFVDDFGFKELEDFFE